MIAITNVGWYYGSITIGAFAFVVFETWWWRHKWQKLLRQYLVRKYGRDVPVEGSPYVTKAGEVVDPDPSDGDQSSAYVTTHLLEPVDWVDGTEPVRCPRCHVEMERRLIDGHNCPGKTT